MTHLDTRVWSLYVTWVTWWKSADSRRRINRLTTRVSPTLAFGVQRKTVLVGEILNSYQQRNVPEVERGVTSYSRTLEQAPMPLSLTLKDSFSTTCYGKRFDKSVIFPSLTMLEMGSTALSSFQVTHFK